MLKHLFAIVIGVSAMLPVSAGEVSVIDTPTDINTNGGWWPGLDIYQ